MKAKQILIDDLYCRLKSLPDNHLSGSIIILESQHPHHPESTQTYVAACTDNYLMAKGRDIEWHSKDKNHMVDSDPWEALEQFRTAAGWAFGYIGYDTGRPVSKKNPENRIYYEAPDMFFMEPVYLFRIDDNGMEQLMGDTIDAGSAYEPAGFSVSDVTPAVLRKNYIRAVESVKHMIAEGDFYELNYSYPIERHLLKGALRSLQKNAGCKPGSVCVFY